MTKPIKNILIFGIVFIFTLSLLDLFIKYTGTTQMLIYNYDKYLGRLFINNSEYMMTTEGFAMGTINEYGYIGPGYDMEKTPGKIRIALLGDSYIEGFQHFDRNHLRAVLERDLKQKYNIDVEVMNFGRFGYNLSDMYSFDKNLVSKFDPDITLFFISGEDLSDTTLRPLMPHTTLINDSIILNYTDPPAGRNPWYLDRIELSKVSPTVMMIRNCMTLAGKGETPFILFGKFGELFKKTPPKQETVANTISPITMRIFKELSRNSGNVIVYRDMIPLSLNLRDSIIKTGVNFISVTEPILTEEQNGKQLYFLDKNGNKGHWNIQAHELIGSYLANLISKHTFF
ncbi:MAG: SGNH/GDSL hydrolase family protein [Ignavibacteriae bacterium]|nr:SGNH/GDSL hydrolase family protein [Ignavibacteriota bacterium]MCB9244762.1 SGNH/GDSL hydrolase family protein [Ignavibacteriales bacterium]